MFQESHFNSDINKWNTSQVEDMSWMFYRSIFNGDISQWDTSKVKNMTMMFSGSQFNGDLRKWQLNEEQMQEIFGDTLPQYLDARRSLEEKTQLCATFTPPTTKPSNKKHYKLDRSAATLMFLASIN
jgi:surface protein